MTPPITISNLSDKTYDELTTRAQARGQSLQEYLSAKLNEMVGTPFDEPVKRDKSLILAEIREHARHNPPIDLDRLLADLDADRR